MKFLFYLAALLGGFCAQAQIPVDSTGTITVGGIKQFVSVKSRDNSKPLLLFLHGGPGGSVMRYSDKFTHKLQEHFIVVQWDQRETGETLRHNASPVPLTLSVFQDDTHELINKLLERFNRQKLYLAGHSWGTALGFHIARKYPELLYAYMPIGPMINQLESERIILEMMQEKAKKENNVQEMEELNMVKVPFENGEQLYYHRKWLFRFIGSKTKLSKHYVTSWAATWLKVYNEACKDNLIKSLQEVNCPVYFFAGRKDYQTNSFIAEGYYQKLVAPKKGFFWFERSAHALPTSEPDLLQETVINKVLAETFQGL